MELPYLIRVKLTESGQSGHGRSPGGLSLLMVMGVRLISLTQGFMGVIEIPEGFIHFAQVPHLLEKPSLKFEV